MGATTDLRRALKGRFYSHLSVLGFVLDTRYQPMCSTFRRRVGTRIQIVDVTWDKYGRPRFTVTFGTCPADGLMFRGEGFSADNMRAGWCPDAGNLQRRRGAGWSFRQDATWLQWLFGRHRLRTADAVVDELLTIFPEVERYWNTSEVGPHLRQWHLPRRNA